MSNNKVNLYFNPNRKAGEQAYVSQEGVEVDNEELTERVKEQAPDVEEYMEKVFDPSDLESEFVGTVSVSPQGVVEQVRVATQVVENPSVV